VNQSLTPRRVESRRVARRPPVRRLRPVKTFPEADEDGWMAMGWDGDGTADDATAAGDRDARV